MDDKVGPAQPNQPELEQSVPVAPTDGNARTEVPIPEPNNSSTASRLPPSPVVRVISVDSVSKWTAIALVCLYVVGFLITSLNDFRYGFIEMNPLRPRILAAGGWFTIFTAVPFAVLLELKRHSLWQQNLSKWHKAALLLYTYYILENIFVTNCTAYIFSFDDLANQGPTTIWGWIQLSTFLFAVLAAALLYYFHSRFPKWIVAIAIFLFFGWLIWRAIEGLFIRKMFLPDAPIFWFLAVGAVIYTELSRRDWKPLLGDWSWTLVVILGLVTMFATVYYPHIMPKWGGGAPIPVVVTLSKDAPYRPGQAVNCSLIDETDSGFYVAGTNKLRATFIPRSEVVLVDFVNSTEKPLLEAPQK